MNNKNISLLEFESNPNIGLYMFSNDKFCLIGNEISEKTKAEIEKNLNVPVYKITILGTELVGVFVCGNNKILILPDIYKSEFEIIDKICKKHKVNILSINEKLNTFGNNLCVSNNKIIINPNYSKKFINLLNKKTKYEIIVLKNKKYEGAGSVCKFLNNKFFISQEIEEKEVKKIIYEIGGIGTVNSGSNLIASGIVGNKNGILLGSSSSTIEIQNIIESLDYI